MTATRIDLSGYQLTIRPLLNKLTSFASDYDTHAKRFAQTGNEASAAEMRRAAGQLRLVRDLTANQAMNPREAALWASAAARHLDEIRRMP